MIKKMVTLIDDNYFFLSYGKVLHINQNKTLEVKITFKGKENILPAVKVLSSKEFSFVPKVGTEIILGFINGKIMDPVCLGSLSSFKENEININENIIISKTSKKIKIKNELEDLKDILNSLLSTILKFGTSAHHLIPNTLPADLTELAIKINNLLE